MSNDGANRAAERTGRGVVTVVPLTSATSRVLPFQVLINAGEAGLRLPSKAQAEQIRAVATERVGALVGRLSPADLEHLDAALRLHLAL